MRVCESWSLTGRCCPGGRGYEPEALTPAALRPQPGTSCTVRPPPVYAQVFPESCDRTFRDTSDGSTSAASSTGGGGGGVTTPDRISWARARIAGRCADRTVPGQ